MEESRAGAVAAGLKNFCEEYPGSWRTGDAAVRWMEVALERLFDRDMAGEAAEVAVGWAKRTRDGEIPKDQTGPLPAWYRPAHPPIYRELKSVIYRCYARAGLVAYLQDSTERAAGLFKEAKEFEDSPLSKYGVDTGMQRWIGMAKGQQETLTPDKFREGIKDVHQQTGLRLADLVLNGLNYSRAMKIYRRIYDGQRPFPRPTNRIKSYLILRMAQVRHGQRNREKALELLKRLSAPKYSKYPWTAAGISRLGTWTFNATDNHQVAMKYWKQVFTQHPDHPDAEVSLYFYATSAMSEEKYRLAEQALKLYLKRYPDSKWTERVQETLLPEAREKKRR